MITPPVGSEWTSLHQSPPDGAGPIGPDQAWPQPSSASFQEVLQGLNPLQHVPGLGMIYRAATNTTIPLPLKIAGSAIFGGPAGVAGAVLMGLFEELLRMGPDQSRPPSPEGMPLSAEGTMAPVTPGEPVQAGSYLTLATTVPDFLRSPDLGEQERGRTAYAAAEMHWLSSHGGGEALA